MTILDTAVAVKLIESVAARIAQQADELSRLDAIAGDGDHGVNMSAAFTDAVRRITDEPPESASAVFRATGAAFSETVGGASGALLGTFFTTLAKGLDGNDSPTTADVLSALQKASARLVRVGRSELGQKTMVDALLPAIDASIAASGDGADLAAAITEAAVAARAGAEATAEMTPTAGRARYAADKSLGTPDPGAVTISHLFSAWAEVLNTEVKA